MGMHTATFIVFSFSPILFIDLQGQVREVRKPYIL